MSIMDFFSKHSGEVKIKCSHCGHHYHVSKPRILEEKEWDKQHVKFDKLEEDISGVYLFKRSEVVESQCENCGNKNFTYYDEFENKVTEKEAPKNTIMAKELLKHWIEK